MANLDESLIKGILITKGLVVVDYESFVVGYHTNNISCHIPKIKGNAFQRVGSSDSGANILTRSKLFLPL